MAHTQQIRFVLFWFGFLKSVLMDALEDPDGWGLFSSLVLVALGDNRASWGGTRSLYRDSWAGLLVLQSWLGADLSLRAQRLRREGEVCVWGAAGGKGRPTAPGAGPCDFCLLSLGHGRDQGVSP